MNRFILLSLVLTLLIVSGCGRLISEPYCHTHEEANRRREAYVQNHPDLSEDVRDAILWGEVIQGMNKPEVQAAMGKPSTTSAVREENGHTIHLWYYYYGIECHENYEVKFVNGESESINEGERLK